MKGAFYQMWGAHRNACLRVPVARIVGPDLKCKAFAVFAKILWRLVREFDIVCPLAKFRFPNLRIK
jgi:hypothetical protein